MSDKLAVLVLAAALGACASPASVPFPATESAPSSMAIIETRAGPRPAADIPESERIAWYEANRPRPQTPPRVEQVVVVEERPVWRDRYHDPHWGWWLPFSFHLGYRSGWRRGWGWGAGWCW